MITVIGQVADPIQTRREFLMLDAIDPVDGKLLTVQISHQRIIAVGARSYGQAYEARDVLPQVLSKPSAIYEGLCWDSDEDRRGAGWRCYAGVPDCSYTKDGTKQGPWENELFLAFINADRVVYNWRWEKIDPETRMLQGTAVSQKQRFNRKLL